MHHVLALHRDLVEKTYRHSAYEAFGIADPKPRSIHKASVRDRLLHHGLYRVLYSVFDHTFIADSFSCRVGKGTLKALDRFRTMAYRVSKNHTRTIWVLKCDIRKFFASIDHTRLTQILEKYIRDEDCLWLLSEIIGSFEIEKGRGLPLGNLTSQLLVNVYMNVFDQFVKHSLKERHYIRYADDFVFFSQNRTHLGSVLPTVRTFLSEELGLTLHPDKISLRTLASGVDFLGWVHFPDHRVLRRVAARRMFRKIQEKEGKNETVQSYLGLLGHGNTRKLRAEVERKVDEIAHGG